MSHRKRKVIQRGERKGQERDQYGDVYGKKETSWRHRYTEMER